MEEKAKRKEESIRKKKASQKSQKQKRVLIVCAMGLFIILLGSVIRVDTINVVGNKLYTAENIKEDLFAGKSTKSLVVVLIEKGTGQKNEIPYLNGYHISFENYHTITVTVQEKEIFGCIDYGGVYVYIDKEGMVLDFDEEKREGISVIEGLSVTKAVLHEPIETNYLERLDFLQRLQILLKQHEIIADSLYYSPKGTFRMDIGSIQVFFGDTTELEEKVNVFAAILPTMEGLSGRLYLNEYSSQNSGTGYRFEVTQ